MGAKRNRPNDLEVFGSAWHSTQITHGDYLCLRAYSGTWLSVSVYVSVSLLCDANVPYLQDVGHKTWEQMPQNPHFITHLYQALFKALDTDALGEGVL